MRAGPTDAEPDILNATKAGVSYGLTMELFIEQSEYIETLSTTAGLRVALHSQWEMPFPEEGGVNVPPGQESDIGVVKVHVHRLEEPYSSRCTRGHEIRNYYSEVYGMAYSQEEVVIRAQSVNRALSDAVHVCDLEEIFELTLSAAQWPSAVYLDSFSRRLENRRRTSSQDTDNIRDNVVKLVVYYQQLNYELIEETPAMQLVDLASSIGGLVGLWIGVSVCTVAEFLELCLSIITFSVRQALYREDDSPPNPYTICDAALQTPELSRCTPSSAVSQTPAHDATPLLWSHQPEKHQQGCEFNPYMVDDF
ncbi:hypothetical protein NDU88_004762 [Pleurodeles waltl]|uniref:Uncharacterized protein n=1 Tax=Pleurodeles waltl TaxID=8319 RepID=A0AAV7PGQ4_PLEWA|nr:hypothetical protein NDU88_004762 [Pleurodeles waltl]